MAIEIYSKSFDFCLENCPKRKIKTETLELYADDCYYSTVQKVYCAHKAICKFAYELSGKTAKEL